MEEQFQPPQQDRSRQTQNKLLKATLEVLVEHGLDGATVPRISTAAGVAPASIYRRFKDKDGLLRAAFSRLLERSSEGTNARFTKESYREKTLEEAVRDIVHLVTWQYQSMPRLLQGMMRFIDQPGNEEFKHGAQELIAENFRAITAALSVCIAEGSRTAFKKRADMGILVIASALELRAFEPSSLWSILVDRSEKEIEDELAAMLLSYLRVESP